MNLRRGMVTFALLFTIGVMNGQNTRIIAHRGYWDIEGSAQNSIAALQKADSIGCYGSEFDVWLTRDNQLVINHDPTFKRQSMEKSDASTLTALKLSNGENLPTLKEYFDAARKGKTRLILELKSHSTPERETKAVEEMIALAKKMKLGKRMEYITFSLHALKEFIRLAPAGTPIYYLNGELSPHELKELGCTGPDYHYGVFQKHPEWIEESRRLGLKVNVWTVNEESDMRWFIDRKVDFITTNAPVLLQKLLRSEGDTPD